MNRTALSSGRKLLYQLQGSPFLIGNGDHPSITCENYDFSARNNLNCENEFNSIAAVTMWITQRGRRHEWLFPSTIFSLPPIYFPPLGYKDTTLTNTLYLQHARYYDRFLQILIFLASAFHSHFKVSK